MKKRFCVLLIVLMLFPLAACGGGKNTDAQNPDSAQNLPVPQGQVTAGEPISENASPQPDTDRTDVDYEQENTNQQTDADGIDVDLTILSSTMVYSEVYNMLYAPDSYLGKTIKMSGQFACYEDPETKNHYFACIIADATACCSQGLEFVLTGEPAYPEDYPAVGDEITVIGTFELYDEGAFQYCRLADATLAD